MYNDGIMRGLSGCTGVNKLSYSTFVLSGLAIIVGLIFLLSKRNFFGWYTRTQKAIGWTIIVVTMLETLDRIVFGK
jgi:cytochrome c oxidase subunit IV